jgi:hypothetical protein
MDDEELNDPSDILAEHPFTFGLHRRGGGHPGCRCSQYHLIPNHWMIPSACGCRMCWFAAKRMHYCNAQREMRVQIRDAIDSEKRFRAHVGRLSGLLQDFALDTESFQSYASMLQDWREEHRAAVERVKEKKRRLQQVRYQLWRLG